MSENIVLKQESITKNYLSNAIKQRGYTMKRIRKAIIPAAGLGLRFLPATKAMPKEVLPIVDKPAIHHIVEEAIESGIEDILIITGRSKRSIEDYFDRASDLEVQLKKMGKTSTLEMVQNLGRM